MVEGKGSGRIQRVVEGGPFGSLTTGTSAQPYRGKRIKYSGHLRSQEAEVGGLWMRIDRSHDGRVTTLAFDNMQDRPVRGTTDWAEYAVVLDVPDDAHQITFGFLLNGSGTLWGDNLKIDTRSRAYVERVKV